MHADLYLKTITAGEYLVKLISDDIFSLFSTFLMDVVSTSPPVDLSSGDSVEDKKEDYQNSAVLY